MAAFTSAHVTALLLLALVVPAQAGNDFNSSRSNRERGTLAVAPVARGSAQDFNTTRSNKEKGALTHVHGDPHVDQAIAGSAPLDERVAPPVPSSASGLKGPSGHVAVLK